MSLRKDPRLSEMFFTQWEIHIFNSLNRQLEDK